MVSPNTPTNADQLGGTDWVKITIPLTTIAVMFVALRVWWRLKMIGKIGYSDMAIIAAAVMAIIQEVIGCIGILKWGFGHHGLYLGKHNAQKALMYFYLYQIPYKILVSLTKISFLFLYLDIFIIPRFQMVCWIVNWSVIAAMFAFTLTTVFQCHPIEYNWNRTIPGHCINAPAFWYGHAAWNTALDIIILLLPVPVIRSLQMAKAQKIALVTVFALGAFVCITSIMRMVALDIASKATVSDLTYATGEAFIWTQVESDVGIICCCLPTLKALATRLFPKLSSKGWTNSSNAYQLDDATKPTASRGWKDNSGHQSRIVRDDPDASGSQDEIMGIQKTIDVSVTRVNGMDSSPDKYNHFLSRA